ncbi:MAG: fumarylacetoacetate hydrolase family protein [Bauldia sp.]|uniref:fumarylacetoacetate hydrolase family protein n=1 Tax=Bauldia sp. TaxID=2575872 RepID=UPI001D46D414|nr:fumarylacetoacetate hydrolase family protein [Bauldia sp.]MCB1495465.1 fumarylacetoacetate hydrolase family protein [Bauldia sp.]
MKLATLVGADGPYVAIIHGDDDLAFDLAAAARHSGADAGPFASMLALIEAGEAGLAIAHSLFEVLGDEPRFSVPTASATFLPPLPRPIQLRESALFAQHIRHAPAGMRRLAGDHDAGPLADVPAAFSDRPVFYFQNRLNVVGHGAEIAWPGLSRVIDYELELGLVVGRRGRNIPVEAARSHFFGYTIYNDFSARDFQLREAEGGFGPSKSKSFDGANAMGPWIVTIDELDDPIGLAASVSINGEVIAEAVLDGMVHTPEATVSYMSRDETLEAGEVIGLGTTPRGCGLEVGRYLDRGDLVELTVEKIGTLANRIGAV